MKNVFIVVLCIICNIFLLWIYVDKLLCLIKYVCFRYEHQQAMLKEELAKIAQRDREAAREEMTKAMTRERQHTRQEAEKTKQLVHYHTQKEANMDIFVFLKLNAS